MNKQKEREKGKRVGNVGGNERSSIEKLKGGKRGAGGERDKKNEREREKKGGKQDRKKYR